RRKRDAGRRPVAADRPGPAGQPGSEARAARARHLPGVVAGQRLPAGRPGHVRGPPVPGALVHEGRPAGRGASRRPRCAVAAALQGAGRADRRQHRNGGAAMMLRARSGGVRRQWGADAHQNPMPAVPRIAGEWAMAFGRAAVVLTVAMWAALVFTVLNSQVLDGVSGHAGFVETAGFLLAVSFLAASATAYLFARLGFYYRAKRHRRMPRALIDEFFAERRPSVTALVPSYQEQPNVILMTLLSTALQEYPDLRVVLLVDDEPNPRYARPRALLDGALALPGEVERLLSDPRRRFELALESFEASTDDETVMTTED